MKLLLLVVVIITVFKANCRPDDTLGPDGAPNPDFTDEPQYTETYGGDLQLRNDVNEQNQVELRGNQQKKILKKMMKMFETMDSKLDSELASIRAHITNNTGKLNSLESVNSNQNTKLDSIIDAISTITAECSAPWKKIPRSGRCYLFSKDVGEGKRNQAAAKQYCQKQGEDLAIVGYLPDTEADPLVTYIKENGYGRIWVGAQKSGSIWKLSDGRILSVDSKLWTSGNPSGDGDCVEIDSSYGLNDLSCTQWIRDFVCQRK